MNAVLLVDDERDFADLLAQRLTARGFTVTTAYDGEQALRLAQGADLDVAVLDVNLPGMDGLEVLARLRAGHPQAEALMLTGQNDLATAVAGMKLGAADYLVKPVPIERLVEAIGRAQERRRERLESLRMAETAKMAALGQMAEGVAHEINNPVNTMVSLAGWVDDLVADLADHLADNQAGNPGPEVSGALSELAQAAGKLADQGRRVKQTTAKLLCLCGQAHAGARPASARPGGTADLPAQQPALLAALLEGLLEERAERMERQGVTPLPALDPSLPPLALPGLNLPGADLAGALGNILDNALDAMPGGGRLYVVAGTDGDSLLVEVEDTGGGIAPEHLPRVFEPFYSTKDVGQGSGLGLSVAYGTVRALGGDIAITSPPGRGARVVVSLPAPAAA